MNIIRLLWLQAELWYQLLADTTEKECLKKIRKRHNNTTEIQGRCRRMSSSQRQLLSEALKQNELLQTVQTK